MEDAIHAQVVGFVRGKQRYLSKDLDKNELISCLYLRLRLAERSFSEDGSASFHTYCERVLAKVWRWDAALLAKGIDPLTWAGKCKAKQDAERTYAELTDTHTAPPHYGGTSVTDRELVVRCLEVVDPEARMLVIMYHVHGCTQRSLARLLGKSEAVICHQINTALKEMRQRFKHLAPADTTKGLAIG